jgi:hypothetical protein
MGKQVVKTITGSKQAVWESWAAENLTVRYEQWVSGETPQKILQSEPAG